MKVSVALISFNGSKFIKEQIDSILNQDEAVDEIIIFDDCSTDNTWNLLIECQRKYPNKIYLYQNEKNIGYYLNIQQAIKRCTNDIICLADQDDIWLPDKLAYIKQYFNDHADVVGICTNGFIINENSILLPKYDLWQRMSFPYELVSKNNLFKEYIYTVENAATGASIAFKKNALNIDKPFPPIPFLIHDRWIVMQLLEVGKFEFIIEKLLKYRIHDQQSIGGIEENIERYLEYNQNILLNNFTFSSFKDVRFILNKIENNIKIIDDIKNVGMYNIECHLYLNKLNQKLLNCKTAAKRQFPFLMILRKLKKKMLGNFF